MSPTFSLSVSLQLLYVKPSSFISARIEYQETAAVALKSKGYVSYVQKGVWGRQFRIGTEAQGCHPGPWLLLPFLFHPLQCWYWFSWSQHGCCFSKHHIHIWAITSNWKPLSFYLGKESSLPSMSHWPELCQVIPPGCRGIWGSECFTFQAL